MAKIRQLPFWEMECVDRVKGESKKSATRDKRKEIVD